MKLIIATILGDSSDLMQTSCKLQKKLILINKIIQTTNFIYSNHMIYHFKNSSSIHVQYYWSIERANIESFLCHLSSSSGNAKKVSSFEIYQ